MTIVVEFLFESFVNTVEAKSLLLIHDENLEPLKYKQKMTTKISRLYICEKFSKKENLTPLNQYKIKLATNVLTKVSITIRSTDMLINEVDSVTYP